MDKVVEKWSPEICRKIIENTPLAMIYIGKDGTYRYLNHKFTEITGYDLSDIPDGKTWFKKAYPDKNYRKEVLKTWNEDMKDSETGEKNPRVFKVQLKNGSTSFLRFIPLRLEGGEYILTLEDVTYRKMVEEALRERESYQRTIFSAIQTGIVVVDASNFKIVDVNKVGCELIGLPKSKIVGQTCHQFICPAQEGKCPIINLNQTVDNSERVLLNKNGHEKPIIKNVVPVTLNGQDCLLESFIDISGLKDTEEELKCSLDEKELLLNELRHRAMDNLMSISSLLDLQTNYIEDQSVLGFFNESKNRARAMSLIYEELYNAPDLKKINLNEYIAHLIQDLNNTYHLSDRNIILDILIDPIEIDFNTAIPLGLIINELISNSMKHAFPEGKRGTISIAMHKEDGQYQLMVNDDGVGMPKDFNIDNPTSLGLELVKNLTAQIEGDLEIISKDGTTVLVSFHDFYEKN
jgi:PAS domain S-box-containing protein